MKIDDYISGGYIPYIIPLGGLSFCVNSWLIDGVVKCSVWDTENNESICEIFASEDINRESWKFITKFIKKELNELPYVDNKTPEWTYWIKFSYKRVTEYLTDYIKRWENDELIFRNTNMLRREVQLESVIALFFSLLDRYNPKHLIFSLNDRRLDPEITSLLEETDIMAVLIFLESNGDLDFLDLANECEPIKSIMDVSFRISLTDKFFTDFTRDSSGKICFNIEKIKKKRDMWEIIFFEPPSLLHRNWAEHRLIKGKLPHLIMNQSFEHELIMSIPLNEICNSLECNEEKVRKDVENFKKTLKNKFNTQKGIEFLQINGNTLQINPQCFQKRRKKV